MENTVEDSAMFWLRCNKCYRLMKKSTRTFSLTQCQHLFCSVCIVGAEKKCPECGSLGVKIVSLTKPLQQPLSHYFESVRSLMQRACEAAHFQRIQRDIAFRRFTDIQGKYDEMKRTYFQSAEQMKSLVAAYEKLKLKNASIAAEITKLQSNTPLTYKRRVKDLTDPNFMRNFADGRPQQSPHMMDYVMASSRSNHNGSRNNSGPSSLNSSRSSLATPFPQQYNQRPISTPNSTSSFIVTPRQDHHNRQQHFLQSGYQNRPTTEGPEYRSNCQSVLLGYAPRVIASHVVTPNQDPRHLDVGWTATHRRLGSAGVSTNYSSTGGTITHTPMVIDKYSNQL